MKNVWTKFVLKINMSASIELLFIVSLGYTTFHISIIGYMLT